MLITIVLNFALIPKYSYMASAWVSMMAYFIIMVISYVLGQRFYPIPYNLKKMIIYLTISLILVYLSFYVFKQNIYIGNGLLALFLGGIYFMEKDNVKRILTSK